MLFDNFILFVSNGSSEWGGAHCLWGSNRRIAKFWTLGQHIAGLVLVCFCGICWLNSVVWLLYSCGVSTRNASGVLYQILINCYLLPSLGWCQSVLLHDKGTSMPEQDVHGSCMDSAEQAQTRNHSITVRVCYLWGHTLASGAVQRCFRIVSLAEGLILGLHCWDFSKRPYLLKFFFLSNLFQCLNKNIFPWHIPVPSCNQIHIQITWIILNEVINP